MSDIDVKIAETHQFTPTGNQAVAQGEGVMSTVTNAHGGRLVGAVTDDCRVTVQGMEMTVGQAKASGLVSMDTDGNISEKAYEPAPSKDIEFDQQTDGGLQVEQSTNEALSNWSHALKEHTGNGAAMVSALAEFMGNPKELPGVMTDLANKEGVSTSALLSEAQSVAADIDQAISDYVASKGVDPRSWFTYTFANRRGEFMSALNEAVFMNNMDAFHGLVTSYHRTNVQAHYQPSRLTSNGDTVQVNLGGRNITTNRATASRNGWL